MPDRAEREWLNEKYPRWEETYGALWEQLERRWEAGGEANTLAYGLPALCNLCQLPALFIRPGRNTACTLEMGGRRYLFCSEPCRWIFEQESSRFADHNSVVDRIVAGEAPGKLTDLHRWMGLEAPVETVTQLADQLVAWGHAPERDGPLTVRNEAGDILDPAATIRAAGLGNGDIFKIERR
jgi:toluene monooxygenase system protein A